MFSATHKLIAHKVYNIIKHEQALPIHYESLLHGSVAPDLYPSMMLLSHIKEDSIGLVHRNIDWLLSRTLPQSKKEIKAFSFRLGIVVHFVSDYFCRAHNEERYNNMLYHFIYEKKLKLYFEKFAAHNKFIYEGNNRIMGDIKDYLEDKHKEYIATAKRTMDDDIFYSLNISTAIALGIINVCVQNSRVDLFIREFEEGLRTA